MVIQWLIGSCSALRVLFLRQYRHQIRPSESLVMVDVSSMTDGGGAILRVRRLCKDLNVLILAFGISLVMTKERPTQEAMVTSSTCRGSASFSVLEARTAYTCIKMITPQRNHYQHSRSSLSLSHKEDILLPRDVWVKELPLLNTHYLIDSRNLVGSNMRQRRAGRLEVTSPLGRIKPHVGVCVMHVEPSQQGFELRLLGPLWLTVFGPNAQECFFCWSG